jgi:hypothetical protein
LLFDSPYVKRCDMVYYKYLLLKFTVSILLKLRCITSVIRRVAHTCGVWTAYSSGAPELPPNKNVDIKFSVHDWYSKAFQLKQIKNEN